MSRITRQGIGILTILFVCIPVAHASNDTSETVKSLGEVLILAEVINTTLVNNASIKAAKQQYLIAFESEKKSLVNLSPAQMNYYSAL